LSAVGAAARTKTLLRTDQDRLRDKQISYLNKLLHRVERIQMFDSFGGSGAQLADEVRDQVQRWGGMEGLTSKQASQLIDQLSAAADDEM